MVCACLVLHAPAGAGTAGPGTYDSALARRGAGDLAGAERVLKALVAAEPGNAELWFQLGLTLRFQDRRAEATAAQRRALSIDPDNRDARLELARLYNWDGRHDPAQSLVDAVLADAPADPEAQQVAAAIARARSAPPDPADRPHRLDLGYEHSSFTRLARPDWNQLSLSLGQRIGQDTTVTLGIRDMTRGSVGDVLYDLGIAHRFSAAASGYLMLGHTPRADYAPRWRLEAGGARRVHTAAGGGALWLTGHLRHDRYRDGPTTLLEPGLRYAAAADWAVGIRHISVIDAAGDRATGAAARIDWASPLPALRLFAGWSRAPETDGAAVVYTAAYLLGATYRVTPGVTLRATWSRDDRQGSYVRTVVSTGLTVRF